MHIAARVLSPWPPAIQTLSVWPGMEPIPLFPCCLRETYSQATGVRWQPEHRFCQPRCLKLQSRQLALCGRAQTSSGHPCSSKTQPAAVFFSSLPFPLQWLFHSSVALESFRHPLPCQSGPKGLLSGLGWDCQGKPEHFHWLSFGRLPSFLPGSGQPHFLAISKWNLAFSKFLALLQGLTLLQSLSLFPLSFFLPLSWPSLPFPWPIGPSARLWVERLPLARPKKAAAFKLELFKAAFFKLYISQIYPEKQLPIIWHHMMQYDGFPFCDHFRTSVKLTCLFW